jgi:hypothetical protein
VHLREDEILYTLEGTFRVRLDHDVRDAPAGTFGATTGERFRVLGGEAGMQAVGPPLSRSHPHRNT